MTATSLAQTFNAHHALIAPEGDQANKSADLPIGLQARAMKPLVKISAGTLLERTKWATRGPRS